MEEVSIIGIDLAKRSFQVHGARAVERYEPHRARRRSYPRMLAIGRS